MPIDKLIINSPYEEPKYYWDYIREERRFEKKLGRRSAGYIIASGDSDTFDDPGRFIEIPLVNKIRKHVNIWREQNYPGVTGITKRLLHHWQDPQERNGKDQKRFFFCQLEAIETLIFLTEAPEAERLGIDIPGDGGDFLRWCNKMATGSGKTILMSMIIAWQILNRVANSRDSRFSKFVLVVAPGLTVRNRLAVLLPSNSGNYYDEFDIVPNGLRDSLRQGQIKIINWHALAWDSEEQIAKRKSVDKRGAKSDEAYTQEVLGELKNARNLIVINDEAHHAWRVPTESKIKGISKEQIMESTIWLGGLDRIHRTRGILKCFDLSATPFAPTGKKASEETLYSWIVSDFGLNDAIESGLVKTPRVVIRDDGRADPQLRSRLYHIYTDNNVREDIARSKVDETEPLPDLIKNAYILLGKDWFETKKRWEENGQTIPPVMITVANNTATSSRIKYSFDRDLFLLKTAGLGELGNPERMLQIDSKVLEKAELEVLPVESIEVSDDHVTDSDNNSDNNTDTELNVVKERKLTQKQLAEILRQKVDTVGQPGQAGEMIQNVISVGMLSEGWDAKTVTHIMGLRAFSSQLLCEQVVGRGLRRTSYDVNEDGFFVPEYVNIFGVPFTFLPHEGGDGPPPVPPPPRTRIEPDKNKAEHEISFPNIIRIDRVYRPRLTLDLNKVKPLTLDPLDSITEAELVPMLNGKPNPAALTEIDLKNTADAYRLQTLIFTIAARIYDTEKKHAWKGSVETFIVQLIEIVETFIRSNKLQIKNPDFDNNELRRRVLIMLNIGKIIQYIVNEVRLENTEALAPVFDKEKPIRSTSDVRTWWTTKHAEPMEKSHINFTVFDSIMEFHDAKKINNYKNVDSFVKNDHLGFVILYNYQGIIRKYIPDFIIRFKNDTKLILETKGHDTDQDKTKREFLNEWCEAVNQDGRFGKWCWNVSFDPNDIPEILENTRKQ
ncbi:MAG: DEAD/DEAH box helicase family protein [Planctomycetaceae bacterium]|jgi:type III restriction enzyme|nr:DEAD/DEAH box helicase family protein [Planctomycetaceae bacterium]